MVLHISCFRTFRCLFGGEKALNCVTSEISCCPVVILPKKVNKTVGLACERGTLTTVLDEVQGCPRWIRTYGHDWLVVQQTTLTYSLRNWHTTMLVSSPIWKKWHSTVAVSFPHFLIQIHFQYHPAEQNLILHNQNVCLSHTKYQKVHWICSQKPKCSIASPKGPAVDLPTQKITFGRSKVPLVSRVSRSMICLVDFSHGNVF